MCQFKCKDTSTSNFIYQTVTMAACLLQEGVKDHGHLFLKLARLVPNHHTLLMSKSILRTWGWTAKILQSYCTISHKRGGGHDCLVWQCWAMSPITSSLLLLPVCPGVSFLGQILSSTACLTTMHCNRTLYQLGGVRQKPLQRVQRQRRQRLAASTISSARASLFPFIF